MAKLEILWRNPEPVRNVSRCQRLGCDREETRLYLVQEFVVQGDDGHWTDKYAGRVKGLSSGTALSARVAKLLGPRFF